MRVIPYLLVALGGALGAVARFGIAEMFARRAGTAFPYGTLFINVTGCFVIAAFLAFAGERSGLAPEWRYLIPIGFVGAYTTFSTYAWEITRLVERGAFLPAAAYLLSSNVIGVAAVYAGVWAGRRL